MCERNRFIKKRRQPWLLVEDEEMPEAEDPPTPRQLQPGAPSKIVTLSPQPPLSWNHMSTKDRLMRPDFEGTRYSRSRSFGSDEAPLSVAYAGDSTRGAAPAWSVMRPSPGPAAPS